MAWQRVAYCTTGNIGLKQSAFAISRGPCRVAVRRSASEVASICLNVMLPLLGHCVLSEDGVDGTDRLARATVDALVRVDEQLRRRLEIEFALERVDAVHGADLNA